MPTSWVVAAVALLLGATCCQSAVYELKNNGTACLVVNSTLTIKVAYLSTKGKVETTSWMLGKATNITGHCASPTSAGKGPRSAELLFNASGARLLLQFSADTDGRVSLANVSLTVNASDSSKFRSPNITGLVTLTGHPNLPLSSVAEHFACHSAIKLPLAGQPGTSGSGLQLSKTLLQAFNLVDGKMSGKSAVCPEDKLSTTTGAPTTTTDVTTTAVPANTTDVTTTAVPANTTDVTTTAAPANTTDVTTTAAPAVSTVAPPPDKPPLLNLTVLDPHTNQPCLRLRARLQLRVAYMKSGSIGVAIVPMLDDAVASGNCGGTNDTSAGSEQTLRVKFFHNTWLLQLRLTLTGSTYALTSVQLDYTVNDTAVFPGATDAGKRLTAVGNRTYLGGVPSNGYYACSHVNATLDGGNVSLAMDDMTLQAFRKDNATDQFTGQLLKCPADTVGNVVPIAVGAALAALVVIVLVAYLIGRRRQSGREGYQSV